MAGGEPSMVTFHRRPCTDFYYKRQPVADLMRPAMGLVK